MKRRLALGQKKSKEAFKRQLRVNATLCASFGIITVQLRNHFETSDFASGFLLGIAIALLSGSIYLLAVCSKEKAFNRYYVKYYDERSQHIRALSLQMTLALVVVLLTVLACLYAFWQISLPYMVLITLLLYTIILGRLLITAILNKTI
ncbi:hypothetical protein [Streptococcus porci]|uniref:hypothetical protein n=1 Tax=Streptococcus porci TaxID=502567 RepID=UPI0004110E7B|nr:hypothetical protein [Streptococcus porci]